jgi:hypothetical protein
MCDRLTPFLLDLNPANALSQGAGDKPQLSRDQT